MKKKNLNNKYGTITINVVCIWYNGKLLINVVPIM